MLSTEALANKVVNVEGASLGEIANRTSGGLTTFYKLISLVLVVVGFVLFSTSIIKLIKINRGELPQSKPINAFAGMIFAAMLGSAGVWLFAATNTLKTAFTA